MKVSLKIFKYINEYGLKNGLKMYKANKYKQDVAISYPFLKHPVWFRNLLSNSDVVIFNQIFETKDYDIAVPLEPALILDMGANVGFASVYFSNRFPSAKIFALEPDLNTYRFALKNIENYPNVTLRRGAIWNAIEMIHVVNKGLGEASIMVEKGSGEDLIQAYTIDSILNELGNLSPDIIKIDIEGAEKEIFESGYENWLPNTKIVIVETHDRYRPGTSKAVFNAINKYNFSLEVSGENLVFYNNDLI